MPEALASIGIRSMPRPMRNNEADSCGQDLGPELAMLVRTVQAEEPGTPVFPWRVRVRSPQGATPREFTLQGRDQVLALERRMEALGYEMVMLDERFRYCDFIAMMTSRQAESAD